MSDRLAPEIQVRVLIVDDQPLIRDGIASVLAIQDGVAVVGTAANGQEAIAQARSTLPDVILMDVRMPVMDGVAATAAIVRELPHCQVLMLTTFDDEDYVLSALDAGAKGYLLKDIPAGELAQAVRLAHAGIYQLDPAAARMLIERTRRQPPNPAPPVSAPPGEALTEREQAVLRLIAQGATNREIAARLVISESTVKNHVSNILSRLGLRDRTQAALYARDHGLA